MDIGNFDITLKVFLKKELNANRLKWRYTSFDKMKITPGNKGGDGGYSLPEELMEQLDSVKRSHIDQLWKERFS